MTSETDKAQYPTAVSIVIGITTTFFAFQEFSILLAVVSGLAVWAISYVGSSLYLASSSDVSIDHTRGLVSGPLTIALMGAVYLSLDYGLVATLATGLVSGAVIIYVGQLASRHGQKSVQQP